MTTEYRVRLDRAACDGVFACLVRDDRFVEAEDGLATIDCEASDVVERDGKLVATFADDQRDQAEQAADACPLDAIDVQAVTPMSDASSGRAAPEPVDDLLAATPRTAYFWGRVAGDGELNENAVTVRTSDETAADALAAIAGTGRTELDHEVTARESAHDASIVRHDEEFEMQVFGASADRASAALGLPIDGQPGGYRFDAFDEHRPQLLRGLLEACGTVCFRESSGTVGVSFVHEDEALLRTVRSLLESVEPTVPTVELSETSSGGYWFGLDDDADVAGFTEWLYAGSDATGLYSGERRRKLRRSVERATGSEVGDLSQ